MIGFPRSRKEALKYRYNRHCTNPDGDPYDPRRCAVEFEKRNRRQASQQCNNAPGHGTDGIYCASCAERLSTLRGLR